MASAQTLSKCRADLRCPTTCLALQSRLTDAIAQHPYSIPFYRERAWIYEALGYPDLAVLDFYKATLLLDELDDPDAEFHGQARDALEAYLTNPSLQMQGHDGHTVADFRDSLSAGEKLELSELLVREGGSALFGTIQKTLARELLLDIAHQLGVIGCFRTGLEYVRKAGSLREGHPRSVAERRGLEAKVRAAYAARGEDVPMRDGEIDVSAVGDAGVVRREVYPWNRHEQDRHSEQALELLNRVMGEAAPRLEVKVTELPALGGEVVERGADLERLREWATGGDEVSYHRFLAERPPEMAAAGDGNMVSTQLGVFAKEDLAPYDVVLHEKSLLMANARMHEPLCDACGSILPAASQMAGADSDISQPVPCPDCDDTLFCSETCLALAQESYHSAVCGAEGIDTIVKDVPGREAADALYTQLLFRALAMALAQKEHPLDLKEVKYIWGDFVPTSTSLGALASSLDVDKLDTHQLGELRFTAMRRTLPFTFQSNVLQPLHFLTLLDLSIFEPSEDVAGVSELWVWNTLLAKFRGTASARISDQDGRPEVAAVHPMWCLANHSCDPNVRWEWSGDIEFAVRSEGAEWCRIKEGGSKETKAIQAGGIKKGEEVLSHYVDIDLKVKDRKEWGAGALGGECRCPRCKWESWETL